MTGPDVDPADCPKHSPEWQSVMAEWEAREQHAAKKDDAARQLETSLEPSD